MSKKDLARELESLLRSKQEHEEKRRQASYDNDYNLVSWYDKEIAEMDRRISDLERRLGSSEDECPNCGRMVVPVSNRCPKCDTYMG